MYKREKLVENQFKWPISKDLLFLIIEDKVSDVFVCELVWERLFYTKELSKNETLIRLQELSKIESEILAETYMIPRVHS